MYWIWIVFCTPGLLSAQHSRKQLPVKYQFHEPVSLLQCAYDGRIEDSTYFIAHSDMTFQLISTQEEQVIIATIFDNAPNYKKITPKSGGSVIYFLLPKPLFEVLASPIYWDTWQLILGNVITPVKIRFQPFQFSKDFTVGPTFGIQYQKQESAPIHWNILVSIGVTSITLDSYNTNQYLENTNEVIAFTPSLGIMFNYHSIQVGIFSGIDIINSNQEVATYYLYQAKPWLGLGFGYAIFSSTSTFHDK